MDPESRVEMTNGSSCASVYHHPHHTTKNPELSKRPKICLDAPIGASRVAYVAAL